MSLHHSPKIITDGLVLCLDAANPKSYPGSGTVWTDLAAGNNGTLINGPTFDSANGGSIVFDGTNDATTFSGNNITGLSELATEFTISVWVKYNITAPYGAFMTKQNSDSITPGTPRLDLGYLPAIQTVYLTTYNFYSGNIDNGNFSFLISNSFWYNIVLVCGSELKRGYINNTLYLSSSFTSTYPDNTQNFGIPRMRPINGNIAQVSIYNRALTTVEIQQNYNATKGRFGL